MRKTYYSDYFEITFQLRLHIHSRPKRAERPKVLMEEIEKFWSLRQDKGVPLHFHPWWCVPSPTQRE